MSEMVLLGDRNHCSLLPLSVFCGCHFLYYFVDWNLLQSE